MSALSCHRERRAPRALQEGDSAFAKESRPFWEFPTGEKSTHLVHAVRVHRESRTILAILLFLSSPLTEEITAGFGEASATFSHVQSSSSLLTRSCRIARGQGPRRTVRDPIRTATRNSWRVRPTDRPFVRSFVYLSVRPSVRLSSLRRTNINLADHLSRPATILAGPRWHSLRERRVVTWPAAPRATPQARVNGGRIVPVGTRKGCRATCSFHTRCRIFFSFFFSFPSLSLFLGNFGIGKFGKILLVFFRYLYKHNYYRY